MDQVPLPRKLCPRTFPRPANNASFHAGPAAKTANLMVPKYCGISVIGHPRAINQGCHWYPERLRNLPPTHTLGSEPDDFVTSEDPDLLTTCFSGTNTACNTVADQLPLEFREGCQDVEQEAGHGLAVIGVDVLPYGLHTAIAVAERPYDFVAAKTLAYSRKKARGIVLPPKSGFHIVCVFDLDFRPT